MNHLIYNADGSEKSVSELATEAIKVLADTRDSLVSVVPNDGDWVQYRSDVDQYVDITTSSINTLTSVSQFEDLYDGKLGFSLNGFPSTPVDENY